MSSFLQAVTPEYSRRKPIFFCFPSSRCKSIHKFVCPMHRLAYATDSKETVTGALFTELVLETSRSHICLGLFNSHCFKTTVPQSLASVNSRQRSSPT